METQESRTRRENVLIDTVEEQIKGWKEQMTNITTKREEESLKARIKKGKEAIKGLKAKKLANQKREKRGKKLKQGKKSVPRRTRKAQAKAQSSANDMAVSKPRRTSSGRSKPTGFPDDPVSVVPTSQRGKYNKSRSTKLKRQEEANRQLEAKFRQGGFFEATKQPKSAQEKAFGSRTGGGASQEATGYTGDPRLEASNLARAKKAETLLGGGDPVPTQYRVIKGGVMGASNQPAPPVGDDALRKLKQEYYKKYAPFTEVPKSMAKKLAEEEYARRLPKAPEPELEPPLLLKRTGRKRRQIPAGPPTTSDRSGAIDRLARVNRNREKFAEKLASRRPYNPTQDKLDENVLNRNFFKREMRYGISTLGGEINATPEYKRGEDAKRNKEKLDATMSKLQARFRQEEKEDQKRRSQNTQPSQEEKDNIRKAVKDYSETILQNLSKREARKPAPIPDDVLQRYRTERLYPLRLKILQEQETAQKKAPEPEPELPISPASTRSLGFNSPPPASSDSSDEFEDTVPEPTRKLDSPETKVLKEEFLEGIEDPPPPQVKQRPAPEPEPLPESLVGKPIPGMGPPVRGEYQGPPVREGKDVPSAMREKPPRLNKDGSVRKKREKRDPKDTISKKQLAEWEAENERLERLAEQTRYSDSLSGARKVALRRLEVASQDVLERPPVSARGIKIPRPKLSFVNTPIQAPQPQIQEQIVSDEESQESIERRIKQNRDEARRELARQQGSTGGHIGTTTGFIPEAVPSSEAIVKRYSTNPSERSVSEFFTEGKRASAIAERERLDLLKTQLQVKIGLKKSIFQKAGIEKSHPEIMASVEARLLSDAPKMNYQRGSIQFNQVMSQVVDLLNTARRVKQAESRTPKTSRRKGQRKKRGKG